MSVDPNFDAEERLRGLHQRIRECRACPLARGYPVFEGRADDRIMLIGQAPARTRTLSQRPFSQGSGGRRLFGWLARAGFSEEEFRAKAYFSAITKCYPGRNAKGKGDRPPSREEILRCRSFLAEELDIIRPRILLTVGRMALRELLADLPLEDCVGRAFERDFGGWKSVILPLPHPSGVNLWNNAPENQARVARAMEILADLRRQLSI